MFSSTAILAENTGNGNTLKAVTPVGATAFCLERVAGIEPARPAWKAGILPLNYTRKMPVEKSIPHFSRVVKIFQKKLRKLRKQPIARGCSRAGHGCLRTNPADLTRRQRRGSLGLYILRTMAAIRGGCCCSTLRHGSARPRLASSCRT